MPHTVSVCKLTVYLIWLCYVDRFKDTVIEERRVSAEALLQFTSSTLHLSSSLPLTSFLTVCHCHMYKTYLYTRFIFREQPLLGSYQSINPRALPRQLLITSPIRLQSTNQTIRRPKTKWRMLVWMKKEN